MALTSAAFAQEPVSPSAGSFDPTTPAPSTAAPVEPAQPPPEATAAPGAAQPVGAPAAPQAPGSSSLSTPAPGELPSTGAGDAGGNNGEPSSGLGMLIPGWILTGTSAVDALAIALCYSDSYRDVNGDPYSSQAKNICAGVYATIGIVSLGIGIPLLVVGNDRRHKHEEWRRRHPGLGELMRTEIAVGHNSALVVYRGSF
ncbi:MAG TPA: hypothetical protein VHB79_23985 [Polyangiaceae bacterium]|nr:hypothetical protein [Polyangiaceae bacterium]